MKKWMICAIALFSAILISCNDDGADAITILDSNFETGADGWVAGFSEYSTKTDSTTLDMESGPMALPRGLDTTQHGFMMQAANRSDDMFMYLKKKVGGLVPNGSYEILFDVSLATKYPGNSMGAGGSPGSSVYLKAGASGTEPGRKLVNNFYEFNLDKGAQSQEGKDGIVLGDVANGRTDTLYALVARSNSAPFAVKASAKGDLWVYVGTDSGFEGLTRLYYDRIRIRVNHIQAN